MPSRGKKSDVAADLSHRELVRAMFAGQQVDRPVVDLGGRVASLSKPAYLALKEYLGYGGDLVEETVTMIKTMGSLDQRVLRRFDVPFRRLYVRPPSSFQLVVKEDGSFSDEWGTVRRPIGHYNEQVGFPLADATVDDLQDYAWPDPDDPGRFEGLAVEACRLYEETDFCLVAGHISAGVFQDCWNLRGMAQFLEDMLLNRGFAEELLNCVLAIHVRIWGHFLDAVGEYVDVVETADDLGTQRGLLISPRMYRDLIKPRHAALFHAIRSRTHAKILFHSCGAIMPLIDDLIEIGVDVLNPIQPLPGLMDPEQLAARYGGRLIFHGGMDVQKLLMTGDPPQVRSEVHRYFNSLGCDQYIMAPANTVQPGTPPQNLVAAYDAAGEFVASS